MCTARGGLIGPSRCSRLVHVDAVDDRHHQIQPAVDLAGVMDRDDVRLGQPGRGVGLAAKPLAIPRLGAQLGGQHLDGHIAVDHGVVGLINLAHAALADHRQQPVTPKRHLVHRPAFLHLT